jgi:DNA-binding MarR family transcriptional regulator
MVRRRVKAMIAPSLKESLMSPKSGTRRRIRSSTRVARQKAARTTPRRQDDALVLQALQGFRLIFASARAHDADVRHLAGISGSQLWALSEIAASAGVSVNGLAERMALHQTTASNLVNALVERKLVRRVRDEEDQRIVRLHVTTDGKRTLLRAPGPYAGLLQDALRNLDADELKRLRKALAILIGVMRETTTAAAGETLLGE